MEHNSKKSVEGLGQGIQPTRKRIWLFIPFLLIGLLIQPFPIIYLEGLFRIIYLIILPLLLLLAVLIVHRTEKLKKYSLIFFAFFVSSLGFSLQYTWGGYGSTIEITVYYKLLNTSLVVIPIILATRITGNNMASIYLKKGDLRKGLIIGFTTFLAFLLTSVPVAIYLFGGDASKLTPENLVSWVPWLLVFILLNGLKEELWFRGLFLKKFEIFLGTNPSNFLQAIIFSLAHLSPIFTISTFINLTLTFFLGLAFGDTMQKTDSLLGSFLFHAGADIPWMLAVFSFL